MEIIPVMNVETIERSSTKRHTYPRKAKLNIKVTPMRHSRGTRSSSVSSTDSQNSEEDDQRTAAEDIEFIPSRFRIRLRKGAMSNSEDISENTSNYEIFTGCLNTYSDSEHSISKQNINYNELDLIFMCSKCPKKFANRIDLVHHSSTHNVQRGYQCSICDEWYSNKNNLVKHLSVHTKDRPYRCDLCGTTFSRMSYLTKHMNTHTHSKSYICNKCGHSCSHRERITLHVRRHMNNPYDIQQHECPLCDKAFCHPSGLSRHLLSHTGKTYDCVYCNKKFSDHSTLKRHGIKHSQTAHLSAVGRVGRVTAMNRGRKEGSASYCVEPGRKGGSACYRGKPGEKGGSASYHGERVGREVWRVTVVNQSGGLGSLLSGHEESKGDAWLAILAPESLNMMEWRGVEHAGPLWGCKSVTERDKRV
uniref:C2H2-type domain-containing protein n=1 Tax=Timema douglasi TaxID=61478 RepID=A0A7R8VZ30_TIMDO|nr:unnamed protein product [Timema douglasi]